MPSRSTRKRIYLAIAITIALGFLLPPSVNLNHFRPGLSQSLSRGLGRPVSIQDVHLRLLPLPGFTFRQLRIADDDEFGAEPILQTAEYDGQHSSAILRISSLWRGRLEIASISLTQASLNLVRDADGHWNVERLINRAAQVPSAPTNKMKPEARTRFPYIELTDSRINFKFGAEKKPFSLSEAEFALWLAAENRWNVRLKAVPLRTDESVSDTGVIKLSGSFDRASQFAETPFHFQMNWERPQVNAITRIAHGHDPGWRGTVDLNADLKGTPVDFTARTNVNIEEFRRYDIARSSPLDIRVNCTQHFRADTADLSVSNRLEFNCKLPFDPGTLNVQGDIHPLGKSPDVSVRLFASEIPVSTLVRAILHTKSTLPDDLTGEGAINGDWYIERASAGPVIWKGALTATDAVLRSQTLRQPLAFPPSVEVRFEPPALLPKAKTGLKIVSSSTVSQAVIVPFALDLGGETEISASFDTLGYRMKLSGPVGWARVLQFARTIGLHPPQTDLKGSGILTAEYGGEWQHFAPPTVAGQAQIRSAVLSLRGFSEPLHVSAGTLKFDGTNVEAHGIEGKFPRNALAFAADFSGTRECEQHLICDVNFSLRTDELHESALLQLLSVPSGVPIPFFSSGRQFEAKWLLDVPATGTITARHLAIRNLQARNVSAQLQLTPRKVLIHHWTADLFGGKHDGEWVFDFSGPAPAITGMGAVQHAQVEQVDAALEDQIGTGVFDLQYRLGMSGADLEQLASSAHGSGIFTWKNGMIQALQSNDLQTPPLSFSNWSGQFTIDKQRILLENTKMASTTGVRQVSGDISFNREWNLKFLRADGSGFVATGNIANPVITSEPAKLAEAR
jgi:hypothetical protein